MSDSPNRCPGTLPIDGVLTMFYYEDLPRAVDWYERVVGFDKVMAVDDRIAIFRIHCGSQLALVSGGAGSQVPIRGANKGAILSIQTRSLEAWHQRLYGQDIAGTGRGLEVGCDGRTIEFKIQDPEGYTIEFFEWIE